MKRSLLIYLTILFSLTTLFTYVVLNNELEFQQKRFEKTTTKLKDSLSLVSTQLADANYFSLAKNENAQNYFENQKNTKLIRYEKLIPVVTEKLLDCFLTGTIPVYMGTRHTENYFDSEGIIYFEGDENLPDILNSLSKELYESKIESVNKNFDLAKQYMFPEQIIQKYLEDNV
jgi:hypothetical protein